MRRGAGRPSQVSFRAYASDISAPPLRRGHTLIAQKELAGLAQGRRRLSRGYAASCHEHPPLPHTPTAVDPPAATLTPRATLMDGLDHTRPT